MSVSMSNDSELQNPNTIFSNLGFFLKFLEFLEIFINFRQIMLILKKNFHYFCEIVSIFG